MKYYNWVRESKDMCLGLGFVFDVLDEHMSSLFYRD